MNSLKNNNLIKSASYASVIVAIIILTAKIYGWLATESQSMLASLIDSMLDISSSVINLIAVRVSLLPPDNNHRFGHEKFQDLAIFSQAAFFFASCLFTMFSSTKSLFLGNTLSNPEFGVNVMYLCTFLTFVLVSYQSYVIKKTNSKIIAADKLHYFADLLTNIAVIISLYLSGKYWYIDPVLGILISLYIMHASYKLFMQSIKNLADEEFPQSDKNKILKVASNHTQIKGLHDLKTRYAGNKPFIQLHIELDGKMTLLKAHEITDDIMQELVKIFPGAEIIIHQDPAGIDEVVQYRDQL